MLVPRLYKPVGLRYLYLRQNLLESVVNNILRKYLQLSQLKLPSTVINVLAVLFVMH